MDAYLKMLHLMPVYNMHYKDILSFFFVCLFFEGQIIVCETI